MGKEVTDPRDRQPPGWAWPWDRQAPAWACSCSTPSSSEHLPRQTRKAQSGDWRSRGAFSLIELLVVLGLLVILATIGVAAFSGTRKVSRLVGTEQLITGMIRQARMTARATGQAVMLYVDPDTRSISGVSRLAMWQSDCEKGTGTGKEPFDSSVTGFLDPLIFQSRFGRSGAGLINPGGSTLAAVPLSNGTNIGRNRQLTRRKGTYSTEGFQLGAVIKAQQVYNPLNGPTALGPEFLPLLTISADAPDTPPNTDTAFAGLILRRAKQAMYLGSAGDAPPGVNTTGLLPAAPTATTSANPDRLVWEVVGWVLPEPVAPATVATPELVSSIIDAVKPGDLSAVDPLVAQRIDPTIGGDWMELSLVFSGSSLELWRDGRLIARRTLTGVTRLEGYQKVHTLFIGVAEIGTALGGTATAASTDSTTIFDDIQLVRLGVDQPQTFPGGVEPAQGYRILVHPDGRITPVATASGTPAVPGTSIVWSFTGVFDENEDTANVTIIPTSGAVSTSKVTLSQSAP